jgi:hypothetical protein
MLNELWESYLGGWITFTRIWNYGLNITIGEKEDLCGHVFTHLCQRLNY